MSLANQQGNYRTGLARLTKSLIGRFNGDVFAFTSEDQVGAPPHSDNPYAFKLYAMEHVRNLGYTSVLWLDSSCYAVANVEPIFQIIESKGYFMVECGAYASWWTNDFALNYFGLTREDASIITLYSAGITGLDFTNPTSELFFKQWKESMHNGCFRGDWHNHRHDLSCASIIATRLGFEFEKGDQYLQYAKPTDEPNNDSIVLYLQGL